MVHPRVRSEVPLILASLFISFVIWLIAKQSDLETDWLTVPVEVQNVPPHMIVEADPDKVSVNVQYPKANNNQIVDKNFMIPIDASQVFNVKPTEWDPPTATKDVPYTLRPNNVKSTLPSSIQVVGVGPANIKLKGRLRVQVASIQVKTTGTLPANLMLTAPPRPDPSQLLVTGTPDALAKLAANSNTVATDPIDLSKLQASGQVYPNLRLPDEELVLLGRLGRRGERLTVNVGLTERPVRQTLPNVPINIVTFTANLRAQCLPAAADVVIEGPASALKDISANDIVFSLARELLEQPGQVYEVGLEARLKSTVPGDVAQQIRIVELHPSRISVEFVSVDKQNKAEGVKPSHRRQTSTMPDSLFGSKS